MARDGSVAYLISCKATIRTTITLMKKLILPCLAAVALMSLSACSTDKGTTSSTTTSTSEETTVRSPVTTTTTDTKTKTTD